MILASTRIKQDIKSHKYKNRIWMMKVDLPGKISHHRARDTTTAVEAIVTFDTSLLFGIDLKITD